MTDEEFYDGKDIALESFIELTKTIKSVSLTLFWSLPLTLAPPLLDVSYAQGLFARFLSQLHSRDSRRQFCPPDHWLVYNAELIAALEQIPRSYSLERPSDRILACRLVLEHIPFVISFADRVKLFHNYLDLDAPKDSQWVAPTIRAQVKRGEQ